jgi:SAM-dependent methyltransferase
MPDKSPEFEDAVESALAGDFEKAAVAANDKGAADDDGYVMGRTRHETERLQKQSLLYNPSTRHLFEMAGIRPGMRVLDLGCGAGDVSLIAGTLVGQSGSVVGVDCDRSILQTARRRAEALPQVSFDEADLNDLALDGEFDAVVGRLVLLYLRDPAATLRKLRAHLRGPGIVALQDIDWGIGPIANVHTPLLDQVWRWATEMFARAGLDGRIGTSLRRIFLEAGLPEPSMSLHAPTGGGAAFAGYQYMADGVRSGLPNVVRLGIATAEEVDVDSLADRLREEITSQNGVFALPAFIGAWTQASR